LSNTKYLVVNWSKGTVAGCSETEEEARAALKKCCGGSHHLDTYIIAEVKVLSEMKRVES
jgi:hypothetical protein